MLSKIFAAALILVSATAQGADSEFFFQSKAGQSDLTPRLSYVTATTRWKGVSTDTKFSGLINTGVSYEYGLNDMFAVEGALLFSSFETDSTPKTKFSGLQDPTVTLKGTTDLGSARLRYGLSAGLSLEKAKIKSNNEVNAASGGMSFTPYVGLDTEMAGGSIGGRLKYAYLLERTVEVEGATSDGKVKNGNTLGLSAFYETLVADVVLGGSLSYASHDTSKDQDGDEYIKSYNTWGISLYSSLPFGTWALLPRLDYDFSHSEADKYDVLQFTAAARFNF